MVTDLDVPFTSSIQRVIGDSSNTLFWKDVWIEKLDKKFDRLYRLESNKGAKVMDRVAWINGKCVKTWQWTRDIFGRAEGLDSWKWELSSNGLFTTKKLQKFIEENVLTDGRGQTKTLRNSLVPRKVEIFIWRVLLKRIPVLIELDKCGIDLHSVRCPICVDDVETIDHSLVLCKKAFDIWCRVYKWWELGNFSNISIFETFAGSTNTSTSGIGRKIW
ncbi:uncharacterized protein [Rutidosis leptorrhynchoides]|uniref:uncharacterized protein n=1 Tax=Rutidosis leptorrhynchoides TaxID=125765 RepID=UPI003A990E08